MAKTERLQVRIEPEVKAQANALFENLGMTTSDAVMLFIHHALNKGGLPFSVDLSGSVKNYMTTPQGK